MPSCSTPKISSLITNLKTELVQFRNSKPIKTEIIAFPQINFSGGSSKFNYRNLFLTIFDGSNSSIRERLIPPVKEDFYIVVNIVFENLVDLI